MDAPQPNPPRIERVEPPLTQEEIEELTLHLHKFEDSISGLDASDDPNYIGPTSIPLDSKDEYRNPNSPNYDPEDPFQAWRSALLPPGFDPSQIEMIDPPPANTTPGHTDPFTGDWVPDPQANPYNIYYGAQSDRYTYGPDPRDPTSAPHIPTSGTTMITAAEAGKRGIDWWNMPLITVQTWNADWDDWEDLEWYVEVPS